MQTVEQKKIEAQQNVRVWAVADFCRRFRLDTTEERRLRTLLGDFAREHELLMNAHRKPAFR
ncbi:hypothetical protein HGO38_08905 [Rhizobium sp. CG5]|uniref:hypothetical protein n=1 Tax=Rhizobium sp. CG5 TaxID=2726076 RepID=UPI0020345F59|nr:hypothetical protein [Rhizobium sp. CG5]MCM2473596.1 hypothetical protein [Rhizobium sp. CG5]